VEVLYDSRGHVNVVVRSSDGSRIRADLDPRIRRADDSDVEDVRRDRGRLSAARAVRNNVGFTRPAQRTVDCSRHRSPAERDTDRKDCSRR